MKKKLTIGFVVLILIIMSVFIITRFIISIGGETILQYQANDIKQINVVPLDTYSDKELNITERDGVEEFTNFINSMKFKKLKEGGIIGGETPQYIIRIIYKSGEIESIYIRHAMPRGIIREIFEGSYVQIIYEKNYYRCVNCSYYDFENYVNRFN